MICGGLLLGSSMVWLLFFVHQYFSQYSSEVICLILKYFLEVIKWVSLYAIPLRGSEYVSLQGIS